MLCQKFRLLLAHGALTRHRSAVYQTLYHDATIVVSLKECDKRWICREQGAVLSVDTIAELQRRCESSCWLKRPSHSLTQGGNFTSFWRDNEL
jgi:hypothetical protein